MRSHLHRPAWRVALAGCAAALLWSQPPAGTRQAYIGESGNAILPGGREVTPLGDQFPTGPGAFGLAISAAGEFVAAADSGPNRYAVTLLDNRAKTVAVRHLQTARRRSQDDGDSGPPDDDPDWHSVFMGIAFDNSNTLWVSEGESGRVRAIDAASGKRTALIDLNGNGYRDSYSGDLAIDRAHGLAYVVDQANFRLAVIDTKAQRLLGSVRTGRLPFAVALAPDGKTVYVADAGMFRYSALPGADKKHARQTGLPFPAFGFPSADAVRGVKRQTEQGMVAVPGLGEPNAAGANSLTMIDVSKPASPRVIAQAPVGIPYGGDDKGATVLGGASPSGVVATADRVFVSNANQDTISVFDARTRKREKDIELRIPGFESLRGIMPMGLTVTPQGNWLLVAEPGINAIGVIDLAANTLVGHIPAGWFPSQVRLIGDVVYVANAKGAGTGPNSDRARVRAGGFDGELRRGSISRFRLPLPEALGQLTARVMANNGFAASGLSARSVLPAAIDHVVVIVKENRTYDEVFGDLGPAANGPRAGLPALARWGEKVSPNHHALAGRFATSDNFYADSEVSVDGHHWLVGAYPNAWVTTSLSAAYGGQKSFRLPTAAPGRLLFAESNSSVHPEDQPEGGAIWHHLERNHISFRNFGEGFELAGIDEGTDLEPTGGRFLTNVPMPEPLFRNTSRRYPGFNTNISDQYRAQQFLAEIGEMYGPAGSGKPDLPQFLYLHLPNDHTARARPKDGYPSAGSFVADNDLALGKILEFLSHSPWWPRMAVFITEDDAQSGVDHVDSHRTVLMVVSPYAKANYSSHVNASFPGMLRTAFELLRLPPLNLYDAAAADLSGCFTNTPNLAPYAALPVDAALFDPSKVKIAPNAPPGPRMDDPKEIERQRREQRRGQ
jgi:DNA-binding beta-propeller fold protein YncE